MIFPAIDFCFAKMLASARQLIHKKIHRAAKIEKARPERRALKIAGC
jgi:hypothetical protein